MGGRAAFPPGRGNEKEFGGNDRSEIPRLGLGGSGLFRTVSRCLFHVAFEGGTKEKGSCSPPGVCLSPSSEQEAFSKRGRRGDRLLPAPGLKGARRQSGMVT